jgi:LysM repeat protein
MRRAALCLAMMALAMLACVRGTSEVIVITATPESAIVGVPTDASAAVFTPFPTPMTTPTPDPTRALAVALVGGQSHTVQPGDTLSGIAQRYGTTIEALMQLNAIANADTLYVGQTLALPEVTTLQGGNFKIVPDSRLVRAPGSAAFDVLAFVSLQPGYIRNAAVEVDDQFLTAAQAVQRVSLEYSVDARLLLALLEFRSRWLSNPVPDDAARDYPMGAPATASGFDRKGLYFQLAWAADNLNRGYYGWKQGGLASLAFGDGTRVLLAPDLNAGTAGVQYLLSLNNSVEAWTQQVSVDGFYKTYFGLMGDPFAGAVEPLVPPGLQQPPMNFPFPQGETWFFTGGPHGGWGSGSAWAAVDFAPPDDLATKNTACYVSDFFAAAVAPGLIARTDVGTVILDLDGDGDESTGWSVLYLHIAARDRVGVGTWVNPGDRIGRPSCEGGVSNGTHIHIARRYNGEWVPAACVDCPPQHTRPTFIMSEWAVVGLPNQEYQGYLARGGDQRVAEQLRGVAENRLSW